MKKIVIIIIAATFQGLYARNIDNIPQSKPSQQLNTRAGDCVPGRTLTLLDINNIRAQILNTGDMWWDRKNAFYQVPKITQQQLQNGERGPNALFSGGIWLSGIAGGKVRMAAETYSTGNQNNFWTGPIKQNENAISKEKCNLYDKFWSVTSEEIKEFKTSGKVSDNIKNWPGKGNPFLISSNSLPVEDLQEHLAPFYDANSDDIYNPSDGDYPAVKYIKASSGKTAAVADQMIFWVLNDVGNSHSVPDGPPIGLQMNCLAFAYATSDEFNNMTFYTYELHNKSEVDLSQSYISQFVDVDLGFNLDDMVGCDTTRDMGYAYNGDNFDESSGGIIGYQDRPPVIGVDFFEGPKDALGNQLGMSSFNYFVITTGTNLSDPRLQSEFRAYQTGLSRQGLPFTVGGNCLGGNIPTKFCFPDKPSKQGGWSMCQAGIQKNDYRFLINSGPFTLESGSKEVVSIGAVFVQPVKGAYSGCAIELDQYLFFQDDKAQRLFDNGFQQTPGPDAPVMEIVESDQKLFVNLVNPPGSNNASLAFNSKDISIPNKPGIKDSTYKFEGYMVYQLSKPTVSSFDELQDKSVARLIKKMDVVNNVTELIQFELQGGSKVPVKSITFSNSGIDPQFVITDDLFEQEGQSRLINEKPYYFAVVAVAYNNFYDSTGIAPNNSQFNQYKISNKINVYSAVPYNNNFYGIQTNSQFGQKIDVTREIGQGHGTYYLEIPSSEEAAIVKDYQKDNLTYKGGKAPIDVIVNNPFLLIGADYTLSIFDSATMDQNKFNTDSAYWELNINNGQHVLYSEGNLSRPTSESIFVNISNVLTSYGITVNTSATKPVMFNKNNGDPVYGMVGANISHSDSSKIWLKFIQDEDGKDYLDWIRTGTIYDDLKKFNSSYNVIGGSRVFSDSLGIFNDIVKKSIAPYCLTANTNIVNNPMITSNYTSYGPAFRWNLTDSSYNQTNNLFGEGPENNLDSIFSVDLVITNDRDKWSKCVVLETGEFSSYNEGNAMKGQIRQGTSKDKNLQDIPGEVGTSYFPGYAINLETGVRVNVFFGENSRARGQGSANMIWDPNSIVVTSLNSPVMAGGQYVYIANTPYSEDNVDQIAQLMLDNFNKINSNKTLNKQVASVYKTLSWTFMPFTDSTFSFYPGGKYTIPSNVKVSLRVQKPYAFYLNSGARMSKYKFSTKGMDPVKNTNLAKSAFDNMLIVPNPYNAYSVYEANEAQNIVKFVNVPPSSTISIFTTDGILVRRITLKGPVQNGFLGANLSDGQVNTDNSYSWDMRTSSGVLIASGVYYVNVESPQFGSKVMKLFATMRSPDVSNF